MSKVLLACFCNFLLIPSLLMGAYAGELSPANAYSYQQNQRKSDNNRPVIYSSEQAPQKGKEQNIEVNQTATASDATIYYPASSIRQNPADAGKGVSSSAQSLSSPTYKKTDLQKAQEKSATGLPLVNSSSPTRKNASQKYLSDSTVDKSMFYPAAALRHNSVKSGQKSQFISTTGKSEFYPANQIPGYRIQGNQYISNTGKATFYPSSSRQVNPSAPLWNQNKPRNNSTYYPAAATQPRPGSAFINNLPVSRQIKSNDLYNTASLYKPKNKGASPYHPHVACTDSSVQNLCELSGVNTSVEDSIKYLSGPIRDKVVRWLGRSTRYVPVMAPILREMGMPQELVFLPLIESGFNPGATSSAKATGAWQFIEETGRRYGLKVDHWVDERRDPEKSTRAAAAYLTKLYNMFGSWNLALSGYNAGENKIKRVVNELGTNDYWAISQTGYIPKETKRYVPTYIAGAMIANNPSAYGFDDVIYQEPFRYDSVMVDQPMDLSVAALCAETDLDTLKELNPELRRGCTPPNVPYYSLKIPLGKRNAFFSNLANYPKEQLFTYKYASSSPKSYKHSKKSYRKSHKIVAKKCGKKGSCAVTAKKGSNKQIAKKSGKKASSVKAASVKTNKKVAKKSGVIKKTTQKSSSKKTASKTKRANKG